MFAFFLGILDGMTDRAKDNDYDEFSPLSPDGMMYVYGYAIGYVVGIPVYGILFLFIMTCLIWFVIRH